MRILFLATQDLESPSGTGRYLPLARELSRLGHVVKIAALHSNYKTLPQKAFPLDQVEVFYVAQMHVLKTGNQKIYYSPHQLLWLTTRATIALSKAALQEKTDIIHICKPHPMNSIAGILAQIIRKRTLFLDCDDYEAASAHYSGAWQKKILTFFEDKAPHCADHITTHNTFLHQRLLDLGVPETKITDIPNGVDLQRFTPAPPLEQVEQLRMELGLEEKRVVAFIGSMSLPSHPVNLLLEAFQKVNDDLPNTVLMLVGGGDAYQQIQDEITQIGLGDSVRFCGRIPPTDIPIYYRLADVIVDPVYDDDTARSRLPLKLFESWISETPFVSGDVGDRKLVLGTPPAGILANPGDSISLAKCILQVLENPQLAADLKQRGLQRAQAYTWNRLALKLEAAYRKSLERRDE